MICFNHFMMPLCRNEITYFMNPFSLKVDYPVNAHTSNYAVLCNKVLGFPGKRSVFSPTNSVKRKTAILLLKDPAWVLYLIY